jgi:hypothetical protein
MGDDDSVALHATAIADLLDLRVDEQLRITALKRALAKRLHLLGEQPRDPADLALGDPQPERLDKLIDAPGRDAANIGLHALPPPRRQTARRSSRCLTI